MRRFTNCATQGDLMVRRIDKLPSGLKPVAPEGGRYIVAHSETGHHHVIEARPHVRVFASDKPLLSYLQVIKATEQTEALLEHLRNYHRHETLAISQGIYELRRQREHTPQGWRRAAD